MPNTVLSAWGEGKLGYQEITESLSVFDGYNLLKPLGLSSQRIIKAFDYLSTCGQMSLSLTDDIGR